VISASVNNGKARGMVFSGARAVLDAVGNRRD